MGRELAPLIRVKTRSFQGCRSAREADLRKIREDRRISLVGMLIMAVLTLCAGILVYFVMQRQAEDFLGRGLALALQVRVEHLTATIENGIDKTATIATRPHLLDEMRRFNNNKSDPGARLAFARDAQSVLPDDYTAIAFYDREGNEVTRLGNFTVNPEISVPLNVTTVGFQKTPTQARLLRDKVMLLHVDADMAEGGVMIGKVSTEAKLSGVDALFAKTGDFGKSADLAVCAPLEQDMKCFHTTLTPQVFPRISRFHSGKPLPMSYALAGRSGVMTARDYRDHEVVAAYSPVNDLGMGMVLKVDTGELYRPIHTRIEITVLLILVLVGIGVILLRWQVLPLLKKLVRSEQAARDSHDRLLASGAHIRVLTEVSPVGIFLTDANGDCIYVNDRYCEITGLSMPRALGQGWASAVYSEDRERVFNAWYEAVNDRLPFSVECRYLKTDGNIIWILAQATSELNDEGEVKGYVGSITDITERKRAEAALKESEERYRSVVIAMSEGIVIQRSDQTIVACNRSAERILGLSEDQIMGRTSVDPRWRAIHADGSPFPGDTHPAVTTLRTGQPQSNVIMGVHRPDDSLVWIAINSQPLMRNGDTSPYAVVTSFTDITEHYLAEEALRNSEGRYRNIVELAQEGVWQIDADNLTTFVNRKMADMLGYTVAEIQGQSIFMFMDDEGKEITTRNIERRTRGVSEEHEFKLLHKDGTEIWVIVNANPLFDDHGRYAGAFAMISDITDRKRWESALIQSEKNFRALVEDANVGILLHFQGKHEFANARLLQMLSYTLEEFRNTTMKDIVHPDEYEKVSSRFRARMEGKVVPSTYETVLQTKSGKPLAVELTSTKTVWEGKPAGIVLMQDISDRQQAMEQMRKLSKAVEQTADTVIITDPQGVIEYVNTAFERVTGYGRDEAIGQTPRLLKSDRQKPEFYKKLWRTIRAGAVYNEVFINRRKDGTLYYEEKTITPLKDAEGRITNFVATGKDVTERAQMQEHLQYMVQHDALTDLPNRVLLFGRLKRALVRARRHKRLLAIMFIDLDRFKNVNDSLGHEAGDEMLQQLSVRLRRCFREDDTVARFGGDEFVILLDDVAQESDIHKMAQKVIEELLPPFKIGSREIFMTASIGVSMYPNDGEDTSTLLRNADIAMYRAKELGKNTYQFYSADMSARAFAHLTLESKLRQALERGEFHLYYQPQLDIKSGAPIGVEALLRWKNSELGLVMPGEFMPLLEETGLIMATGEWVLNTACSQLRAWHDAGWKSLRMAVNLSARQFNSPSLTASVERALALLGGDPACLELEITESVLMRHSMTTIGTLTRLSTMGCRLAIDDFGTGYSSLSYLKRFPINVLKIDHSFISDIPEDKDDAAIVATIVAMAHNLNLEVVAEGVETEKQLAFLKNCGCDSMQGYLFSRPLPAEEVVRHFKR